MEADLWQFYQVEKPGQVMVAGIDIWNGTPAELQTFRDQTGSTFPLLLNGGTNVGGNAFVQYGDRHNYVVIDQRDTVRFSARVQGYVYGSALDVGRIHALVDSLLASTVGVDDPPRAPVLALTIAPHPASGRVTLALAGATGEQVRIAIHDLAGRRIAQMFDGAAPAGGVRVGWEGRTGSGTDAPAGLYFVRAEVGGRVITRRLVFTR